MPESLKIEIPEQLAKFLEARAGAPPPPKGLARYGAHIQLVLSAITPLIAVILFIRFGSQEHSVAIDAQRHRVQLDEVQLAATQGRLVVTASISTTAIYGMDPAPVVSAQSTGSAGSASPSSMQVPADQGTYYRVVYRAKFTNPNQQPIAVDAHTVALYTGVYKNAPGTGVALLNQPETAGPVAWSLRGTPQRFTQSYGNTGVHEGGQSTFHQYVFIVKVMSGELVAVQSKIDAKRNGEAITEEVISYCDPQTQDENDPFACTLSNTQPQIAQSPDGK